MFKKRRLLFLAHVTQTWEGQGCSCTSGTSGSPDSNAMRTWYVSSIQLRHSLVITPSCFYHMVEIRTISSSTLVGFYLTTPTILKRETSHLPDSNYAKVFSWFEAGAPPRVWTSVSKGWGLGILRTSRIHGGSGWGTEKATLRTEGAVIFWHQLKRQIPLVILYPMLFLFVTYPLLNFRDCGKHLYLWVSNKPESAGDFLLLLLHSPYWTAGSLQSPLLRPWPGLQEQSLCWCPSCGRKKRGTWEVSHEPLNAPAWK